MNKYVFDNGSFRDLVNHFYRKRFPTLWDKFDSLVRDERLFSVREVLKEIEKRDNDLLDWAKSVPSLFRTPEEAELILVREIFKIPHFQTLISESQQLSGWPGADPFLIASAKINEAIVVTPEKEKPNAAKIPNVCKHFNVRCVGLEEFMEIEKWEF